MKKFKKLFVRCYLILRCGRNYRNKLIKISGIYLNSSVPYNEYGIYDHDLFVIGIDEMVKGNIEYYYTYSSMYVNRYAVFMLGEHINRAIRDYYKGKQGTLSCNSSLFHNVARRIDRSIRH